MNALRVRPATVSMMTLSLLLAAGCTKTVTVVVTSPVPATSAPSQPPTPSPTPSPSPTATALAMGKTGVSALGTQITVYSWSTNVNQPDTPPAGDQFSQIDVKFCLGTGYQGADLHPYDVFSDFTLRFADSRTFAPRSVAHNGDEFLSMNQRLVPGGPCVRGVIVFEAPKNVRPVEVDWSSSTDLAWAVPLA